MGINENRKKISYLVCGNKKQNLVFEFNMGFIEISEEVRINLPLFSTVVPSNICMFLSCTPFVVITTLSTGLVGVEITSVSWLGQLTVGV